MDRLTRVAAVLAAVAWVVRLAAERAGPEALLTATTWAGALLLAVALVGLGAGLVDERSTALAAVVGLCFAALVWCLLMVLHGLIDDLVADAAVAGAVAALCLLVRRREPATAG